MCGIAGAVAFRQQNHTSLNKLEDALECLSGRGPDAKGIYKNQFIAFGHRRLSIIDTSDCGNQPMTDDSGRFTIIFNGEIFNYRKHRERLIKSGIVFNSSSDTEVLLNLYILEKEKCLQHLNGFFAFAVYDKLDQTVFIARDRYGIKPLVYFYDENHLVFASENKALIAMGIPKEIDPVSMHLYFQLNYTPGKHGMLKGVHRLLPGNFLKININSINSFQEQEWYSVPYQPLQETGNINYNEACAELYKRLDAAVERRLIADVPLGAFLSGGVDSSVVVALASKHVNRLYTFSIGFSDEPAFDETIHAETVAKHFNTDHKTFNVTTNDLLNELTSVLKYLDEPFADSSALAVNILSKETRKHVTVALSGDGADELFAGYQKHRAEWLMRNRKLMASFASMISPALKNFKGSRQTKAGNKLRQLHRFAEGARLSSAERYWRWCSISSSQQVDKLLKKNLENDKEITDRIKDLTGSIKSDNDFNEILLNDVNLVLPYDMLTKVDLMSMKNSLEIRVPFLDVNVVDFAFSLPESFKIDEHHQKKILKDSFKHLFPNNFFQRKKQGFEVPVLRWLKNDLSSMLDEYLNENFLIEQNLFHIEAVNELRMQLHSSNPGEATARIWALLVFQVWWKSYIQ